MRRFSQIGFLTLILTSAPSAAKPAPECPVLPRDAELVVAGRPADALCPAGDESRRIGSDRDRVGRSDAALEYDSLVALHRSILHGTGLLRRPPAALGAESEVAARADRSPLPIVTTNVKCVSLPYDLEGAYTSRSDYALTHRNARDLPEIGTVKAIRR